jgi:hypothetical protein
MLTGDDVQQFIGLKVTETGTYPDGFWLKLENGQMVFIDQ